MTKNELIDRISKARINANLSARALSLMVDMKDGYISRLESKKDFLPSAEVLLAIIEACGLTEEQFFYHDMFGYDKDAEFIRLFARLSPKKKDALISLISNDD